MRGYAAPTRLTVLKRRLETAGCLPALGGWIAKRAAFGHEGGEPDEKVLLAQARAFFEELPADANSWSARFCRKLRRRTGGRAPREFCASRAAFELRPFDPGCPRVPHYKKIDPFQNTVPAESPRETPFLNSHRDTKTTAAKRG